MSTTPFRRPSLIIALIAGLFSSQSALAQPAEITSLRDKAEKGNSIAQYNLGLSYATGREVTPDLSEAYLWLSLAATNGTTGKALNTLLEQMTPAQLDEGRRRLASHRTTHSLATNTVTLEAQSSDTVSQESGENQLSSELALAWQESEELKTRLIEATEAQKITETELSANATELASLRVKVATLQNTNAQNSHSVNAAAILQREITQLKSASTDLGTENQKLEDIAAQRGRERDTAQRDLSSAQARLATLTRDHQTLQAQVASLKNADQEQLATARALDNTRTELIAARKSLTAINQEQTKLQNLLENAKSTNLGLQSKLQNALNAAAASDSTDTAKIKSLSDDIATLTKRLKAEQTAHAAANSRYESITQELSTTHHALSSGADELVALRIKVGQLESNNRDRLTAETSALQNEIDQLQKQTATLSSNNQRLEDVASERGREIADLNSSLDDTRQQFTEISEAQLSLKNELLNAQTNLRQSRDDATDVQSQLVTLRQKDSAQQQQIARAESTLNSLRDQLEAAQLAAGQPDPAATQRITSLTSDLDSLRNELVEEKTAHSQAQDRLTALSASLKGARQELSVAQTNTTQSQSEIAQQKALLVDQQQLLTDLNAAKVSQQRQLVFAQDSIETLETNLADARDTAAQPDPQALARITELQEEISTLNRQLSQTVSAGDEADTQLSQLATTMQGLRDELADARSDNVTTRQQIARLENAAPQSDSGATARLNTLTEELKDTRNQLTKQTTASEEATKQLDDLVTELGSTRAQISRLKDANIVLSTRLDNTAKNADQEVTSRLESATVAQQAAESKVVSLQAELTSAQAALAAVQSTSDNDNQDAALATLSAQIDTMSTSLGQEQTARESAEQQVASLNQDLSDLRNQLSQSKTRINELAATTAADNSVETTALEAEVSEALSNYALLQEENESLKADSAALTAQIATLEEQLASDLEFEQPEEVAIADDSEMLALQAQLSQTQSELNNARSDSDSLRNRLLALRTAPTRPGSAAATTLRRPSAPQPTRSATTSGPRTHTVVSGDTLSGISAKYYGTSRRWAEIYETNRAKLPNERALRIGMTILVP